MKVTKLVVCAGLVLAGVGVGYVAPRPPMDDDTLTVRSIGDPASAETAKSTKRYNTAQLTSVKVIANGPVSCVDGEVSFARPDPVFVMSDGYGGANLTYMFETQGGTITDIHGDIQATERGYGTYHEPASWNADAPAAYEAANISGDMWQVPVSAAQVQYRVHVTSPVDEVSDWYETPAVSDGACQVSTR